MRMPMGFLWSSGRRVSWLSTASGSSVFAGEYLRGFGAQYTGTLGQVTVSGNNNATFNNQGTVALMTGTSSPYVHAYPFANGFGTKYSNPSTLPGGTTVHAVFSPRDDYVLLSSSTTTDRIMYSWSNGFGTQYTQNNGAVSGWIKSAWTPDQEYVLSISGAGQTGVNVNKWDNPGFNGTGTSYFTGTTYRDLEISPDGTMLAVTTAGVTASYSGTIAPFSPTGGVGTTFTAPVGYPSNPGNQDVFFNHDSDVVFFPMANTPYIAAYPINRITGFGTKYANPATLPSGGTTKGVMSPNDDVVLGGRLTAYPFDKTTGFGTIYAKDASAPSGSGYTIDIK